MQQARRSSARDISTRGQAADLWSYDPATGEIRWLIKAGAAIPPGSIAGTIDHQGYRRITYDGTQYPAHQIAWALHHGSWPTLPVDHRNGVRSDNRAENLRLLTNAENQQNRTKPQCNNRVGLLGVVRAKPRNGKPRWRALVRANGKQHSAGTFDSPEEAHAAYLAAKRVLHATACTL